MELRDKIAGGWAGKMIGVAYGDPTEFRARGETYEKELSWKSSDVARSLNQDDLYVQMSFMMTMDKYGLDAPAEKFAESFANAGYQLWCANVQGRKNFFDGIMPPMSGHPKYNLWADAIDFQIEADYIGFMSPGMPQTANKFADKVGHVMNYGDGVYGGMFVAALYAQAYLTNDISAIDVKKLKVVKSVHFRALPILTSTFLTSSSEDISSVHSLIGRRFDAVQLGRINLNKASASAVTPAYRALLVQGRPRSPVSRCYRLSF